VERDFLKDSADDKKNTDISVARNSAKPSIKTADEADSGAKEDGEKAKKEETAKEEPKKEEKKEEPKKEEKKDSLI